MSRRRLVQRPITGSSIVKRVKNKITDARDSVHAFITKSHRNGLSPPSRKTLERLGDSPITQLVVGRVPVVGAIQKLISVFSLGKSNRVLARNGYDTMFHLFVCARTASGKWVRMERNQTVDVSEQRQAISSEGEIRELKVPAGLTCNRIIHNAAAAHPGFYRYHPTENNCQAGVLQMLSASGIPVDASLLHFIKQPAEELLPRYLKGFSSATTDLASRLSFIHHGVGIIVRHHVAAHATGLRHAYH